VAGRQHGQQLDGDVPIRIGSAFSSGPGNSTETTSLRSSEPGSATFARVGDTLHRSKEEPAPVRGLASWLATPKGARVAPAADVRAPTPCATCLR
jgi:hypothetical protein